MELVGTVKLQSKLKKNSEGIFQLQLMYICGFSKILLLFIPPALAFCDQKKNLQICTQRHCSQASHHRVN